jgi:hypothetical protein
MGGAGGKQSKLSSVYLNVKKKNVLLENSNMLVICHLPKFILITTCMILVTVSER